MPEFKNPVTGSFCWTECATTDTAAARKFYSEVLGWTYAEMPSPNGTYYMAKVGEAHAGGMTILAEEAKKMGAPPHWLNYVAVADCKASAAKVEKLGGKVLVPAFDAGGMGEMSILQDPTGGTFALWQSKQSMGTFVYGEDGALCWNELMTTNVDQAGKFYTNLFGWKAETQAMPTGQYTVFKSGEAMVGGMMQMPADMKGVPSAWTPYFQAKDVDAQVKKAEKAGGRVIVPLQDVPTVGRFAYLLDPQGAAFALIKFAPKPQM